MTRQQAWKSRNPWVRLLEYARRRCNDTNPEGPNYAHYYAKGIICTLTGDQVKKMWDRDNAAGMKKPSIDRIDSTQGYHDWNCRILEFHENVRRAHEMAAAVAVTGREEFV